MHFVGCLAQRIVVHASCVLESSVPDALESSAAVVLESGSSTKSAFASKAVFISWGQRSSIVVEKHANKDTEAKQATRRRLDAATAQRSVGTGAPEASGESIGSDSMESGGSGGEETMRIRDILLGTSDRC